MNRNFVRPLPSCWNGEKRPPEASVQQGQSPRENDPSAMPPRIRDCRALRCTDPEYRLIQPDCPEALALTSLIQGQGRKAIHGVLQSAGRRRHDRRVQGIYRQAGQKGGAPLGAGKAATLEVTHSGGCGGQDKAEGAGTMKQDQRQKAHSSQ